MRIPILRRTRPESLFSQQLIPMLDTIEYPVTVQCPECEAETTVKRMHTDGTGQHADNWQAVVDVLEGRGWTPELDNRREATCPECG